MLLWYILQLASSLDLSAYGHLLTKCVMQDTQEPESTGLAYEDRGPAAAEQEEAPGSPSDADQPQPADATAADSASEGGDADTDARDAGVKSILDLLEEGSEADEPEPAQQQQQQQQQPEQPASAGPLPQQAAPAAKRPVWEDPGDAAEVVDISAKSRSRKLRQHEDEQTVTGGC